MTDEHVVMAAVFAAGVIAAGMVLSVVALKAALDEYRITRAVGDGRFLYAKATLRSQVLRGMDLTVLGGIVVLVMFDVPQRRAAIVGLFVASVMAVVVDASLDHLTSRKLARHFARVDNGTSEEDHDGHG